MPFSKTISFSALFVTLNIQHPDPSTITITIESPQGTRVRLHQNGGTLAQISIYPNPVLPAEDFTAFESENAQGNWQLEIIDENAGGGPGLLNEFRLNFCAGKKFWL